MLDEFLSLSETANSDSQYITSYWNSVYHSSPQVREIISPTHQRKDDPVSDVLANRQNNA
jgi:hypothetical protein